MRQAWCYGWVLVLAAAAPLGGCDDGDGGEPAAEQPAEAEGEQDEAAEAEAEAEEAEAAGPEEACARVIVTAWKGAMAAGDDVTRSKAEARERAEKLRERVTEGGEDFAELAREESDASSSGPRGGIIGTYTKDKWPSVHGVVRDAVFDLDVDGITEILQAPYGWVFAKRCPVEKVHTRHILIAYEGSKRAGDDVTRSEAEAKKLAEKVQKEAAAEDADFAALAEEHSDGPSAERGGDIGPVGRGLLAPEYEKAAFALEPGQVSDVVETDFGFHVIQRVE